jgi:enhancing lycopene biosynthesis protein 2
MKSPVCMKCTRAKSKMGAYEDITKDMGLYLLCDTCDNLVLLSGFGYKKSKMNFSSTCRDCVGSPDFDKIFKK